MTKIQKDYRNWIVWMTLVVSLSLIAWLSFTIKDDIFQPKVFLILLLCFVAHDLIKRLPTPEQVMRDKQKVSQRKPITVYTGKPTECARDTRLAHLEGFINRLGFSSDKVFSFMADDSDRVCKDLALRSFGFVDDKLRSNFNNPDLDVASVKLWLMGCLCDIEYEQPEEHIPTKDGWVKVQPTDYSKSNPDMPSFNQIMADAVKKRVPKDVVFAESCLYDFEKLSLKDIQSFFSNINPKIKLFIRDETLSVEGIMIENNPAVAAIEFALKTGDGFQFLRLWHSGEFDAIRRGWPDAPESVFIGADPLFVDHKPNNDKE